MTDCCDTRVQQWAAVAEASEAQVAARGSRLPASACGQAYVSNDGSLLIRKVARNMSSTKMVQTTKVSKVQGIHDGESLEFRVQRVPEKVAHGGLPSGLPASQLENTTHNNTHPNHPGIRRLPRKWSKSSVKS